MQEAGRRFTEEPMHNPTVNFKITKLEAQVAEPITLEWQGKRFDAGPIMIDLDEEIAAAASQGTLDYSQRWAQAEFHVTLSFPEFAATLDSLGAAAELTQPLRAVIRSEGAILDDHSFALSGGCDLGAHPLFPSPETSASVLPGI